MSLIPNFLITGLLACLLSLLVVAWSAGYVQRRTGGAVLTLLSVMLLLFGGGLFPPPISLAGAVAGTQINRPLPSKHAGGWLRLVSHVWPWPLAVFVVWVLGQYLVGYLFDDFLKSIIGWVCSSLWRRCPHRSTRHTPVIVSAVETYSARLKGRDKSWTCSPSSLFQRLRSSSR